MPGSVTSVFSEAEGFEAALREEGCLSLLVTGRGQFRARLTRIALLRLQLSLAEEQLSRIAFVAVPANMLLISFPIGDRPALIWDGIGMRVGELVTLGPGELMHARTDGPSHWGAIWLPAEQLGQYGRALIGAAFAVLPGVNRWQPPAAAGKHLRQLHRAAIRVATTRPEAFICGETAHGLEQQLIHALVECLSAVPANRETLALKRHRDIAVRFERLLQTQPEGKPRVTEICSALGVSDRSLRLCCQEQLGTSPTRYLLLRRMQLVHRTLSHEGPNGARVAEVAKRYGFDGLGRFSGNYRELFGESPSSTLRRSLDPGMPHLVPGRLPVKLV